MSNQNNNNQNQQPKDNGGEKKNYEQFTYEPLKGGQESKPPQAPKKKDR